MNKQQRKEAAIKYIKEHIDTRYEKWSSPSLDHHGIEEIRSVSEYDALRAIEIAIGE